MQAPSVRLSGWADLALGSGLVVLGEVELLTGAGEAEWWRHLATLLGTAPLAVRRRAPTAVLAVVVGALTILTVMRTDTFAVAELLGLMLATYTVAVLAPVRTARLALGAVLAAAFLNSLAARIDEAGDYVFAVILLGVPWLAGTAQRVWRARAAEMSDLAAELAASREEHARLVVAAERGRIARDLHDSLAQTLNAVVVHAEAAEEAIGRDDTMVRHALTRIREVSRESLTETRRLLGSLRGDDESAGSLRLANLDRLIAVCRAEGVRVEVEQRGEQRPVSPSVEAAAFRIIQESLTNVRRHASGGRAWVTIEHGPDLRLEIRDDGAGVVATNPGGYGLVGMRERAELLGGELTAAAEDRGFVVRARLPIEVPA